MYNITDSYFQKHCIKAVIDCLYDASNYTNLKYYDQTNLIIF